MPPVGAVGTARRVQRKSSSLSGRANSNALAARGARKSPSAAPTALNGTEVLQLQALAGNRAVADMLQVQRLVQTVDPTAPAVPPTPITPNEDPAFVRMKSTSKKNAKKLSSHPPAKAEANVAHNAAVPPSNDKDSQAKEAQVDEMEKAKPGVFDKPAFMAAVRKAIEAVAPKDQDEATRFKESGKADAVKGEVMGKVTKGKEDSAADIKGKSEAPPDPSKAVAKPVTPMAPPAPVAAPPNPGAAAAMPKPAPAEQANLQAPKHEVEGEMAAEGVTEEQLANSNEPQFQGALDAKKQGEQHSATAPDAVRAEEAQVLAGTKAGAAGSAKSALAAMFGAKGKATSGVGADKSNAKTDEEKNRAKVAADIEAIYASTKTDTDLILKDLDGKVSTTFEKGEKEARDAFEEFHSSRVWDWKLKRYILPVGGTAQWVVDQFLPLSPDLIKIFADARAEYMAKMDVVLSNVADLIGGELTRARKRIADGRAQIKKYVSEQKGDLAKVAQEAEQDISGKFDQLDQAVDDKQESMVEDLASKYVEARNGIDERIKQVQDENKGYWEQAKDAVAGAIDTIKKLKDMLLGVLSRAAGAVEKIVLDPIKFLGNLVTAVRGGLDKFVKNIGAHLKKGLMGWLFGQLAEAGIQLPEKFDAKGIFTLIASILGLSWANFKSRLVKKLGQKTADRIEGGVDFVKEIATNGIAGAWKWIVGKLGDLKDQVMGQIKTFVIEKVIMAGITWLIGLLNPAAAFVKACKLIYDVIMFFVEKGEQIMELVNTILDSVEAILSGALGKVSDLIESVLAKILPIAIGFLASVIGLGGLSSFVKKALMTVQKPVNKAFDWLIGKAAKAGKSLLKKLGKTKLGKKVKALKAKGKALYKKGKKYVVKKVKQAKAWAKKQVKKVKKWAEKKFGKKDKLPKNATPEEKAAFAVKQKALKLAGSRLHGVQHFDDVKTTVQGVVNELRPQGLKSLEAKLDSNGANVTLAAVASPAATRTVKFSTVFPEASKELLALKELLKGGKNPETESYLTVVAALLLDSEVLAQSNTKQSKKPENTTGHAEQLLLAKGELTKAVDKAKVKASNGKATTVSFTVSTAPCSDCSAQLSSALSAEREKLTDSERALISFKLLTPKTYERKTLETAKDKPGKKPKTQAQKDEKWRLHMKLTTKMTDMTALAEAGWELSQLDLNEDGELTQGERDWAEACHRVMEAFKTKAS